MKSYLIAFIISFFSSLILVPVVKRLAYRLKVYGPYDDKKIPRWGGLAIYVSFIIPLIGLIYWENKLSALFVLDARLLMGIFIGGSLVVILGAVDDKWNLSPIIKILSELLIASFVYGMGFKISLLGIPFGSALHLGWFEYPATLLWIVGVMNAMNLIDGVDGLATGISLFIVLTLGSIAWMGNNVLSIVLCCALGGSLLGFIRYNFNPAQIYLGDSGSLFLGYLLSILSIWSSQKASTMVALLTPLIALGIPILDMIVSMARRYFRGMPIFRRDMDHVHHRLTDIGFSQRKVVLILYAICILLNGLALTLYVSRNPTFILIFFVLCCIFCLQYLGYLKPHIFKDRLREFKKIRTVRFYRYLLRELMDTARMSGSKEKEWYVVHGFAERAGFDFAKLVIFNPSGQRDCFEWQRPHTVECHEKCLEVVVPVMKNSTSLGKVELKKIYTSEIEQVVSFGVELLAREIAYL